MTHTPEHTPSIVLVGEDAKVAYLALDLLSDILCGTDKHELGVQALDATRRMTHAGISFPEGIRQYDLRHYFALIHTPHVRGPAT